MTQNLLEYSHFNYYLLHSRGKCCTKFYPIIIIPNYYWCLFSPWKLTPKSKLSYRQEFHGWRRLSPLVMSLGYWISQVIWLGAGEPHCCLTRVWHKIKISQFKTLQHMIVPHTILLQICLAALFHSGHRKICFVVLLRVTPTRENCCYNLDKNLWNKTVVQFNLFQLQTVMRRGRAYNCNILLISTLKDVCSHISSITWHSL